MTTKKIALLGFGTVAKGTFDILKQNGSLIGQRVGHDIVVAKILVRDKQKYSPEIRAYCTTDYNDILSDPSIEIVVELTGADSEAVDYIERALKAKKSVVTANKQVVARHGERLIKLAKEKAVSFYFEASVGGGIPVIRTMIEGLSANHIERFYGILNGTTNYILSQMTCANMTYSESLKMAQSLGYAEADPSGDVKGLDAVNKLSILTMIAFSQFVSPDDIDVIGIEAIQSDDIKLASSFGYVIKLLASAERSDDTLKLGVYPALVPKSHLLAGVNDANNAIYIKGDAVGEHMSYGAGAGASETGSAVVADIVSIFLQNSTKIDFGLELRYGDFLNVLGVSSVDGQFMIRSVDGDYSQLIKALSEYSIGIAKSSPSNGVITEVTADKKIKQLDKQKYSVIRLM